MKHQFSVLDVPTHDIPVFEERHGKTWVTYGLDDNYGAYLERLFLQSSIHSAIVQGVGAMIYGEGLEATDREANDGKKEQWLRLQTLLNNSSQDLLQKLALDLKLYGQCYINTIWSRDRSKVVEMRHLPVHTMRSGLADSNGKVDVYYYAQEWTSQTQPQAIRSFCLEDRTEASRVLHIKRYAPSFHYYGIPDYVGSCGYVELDKEIQTMHLQNIKNGLFPSMMLSFNNGVPTDEERWDIERKVMEKFAGADNAGKLLITFNDGSDTAPTFTPINTNGNDGLYQYLSTEVATKVLSGHRVTSPLLFGVRGDGTGFGNNADELRDSYSLFNNTVVIPFQNILLEGLSPVFETVGCNLDLYFKPLKPADFLDLEEEQEMEANWKVSEEAFSMDSHADQLINLGEDEDLTDYELVDSREVDYDLEKVLDSAFSFASVIPSNPNATSQEQDSPLIKVRYKYTEGPGRDARGTDKRGRKNPTRDFCQKMMRAGKVYRKEDIDAGNGANPGFGEFGASTYDIFKYKGGPRCRHYWTRLTYLRRNNERISVNQARRIINDVIRTLPFDERAQYRLPDNPKEVAMVPNDMTHKGYSPNNPNKPSDAR